MNRKHVVLGFLACAAIAFWAFRGLGERYFEIAKNLDIFTTLFKEVNLYYVDEVDPKKLIGTGIEGMLETLDPYTTYIPEEDLETFSIQTTGEYAGIGALIGVVNKKTVVTNPYVGFPAHRAGIRVGDEFLSVDGKNIQGKPTQDISILLKGKPQTQVEVVVRRAGTRDPLRFTLTRERIKVKNVVYQGLLDPETGYLKIDDFTPGAGKEVEATVQALKQQGAKRIILDLRDNPGGLLNEAVNIVNVFLPKGKEIVNTKGKVSDWNKTYKTLNNPTDIEIPLVVLVSGSSASASEIVAGAIQDYDRGLLVGQRTFGKGLVQTTRDLAYNAQLKVTTAKYYIPSGRCIQALDYAHRKADGSVGKLADSLKTAFRTKGGRTVYDGGGLDPDLEVKSENYAPITIELASEGWFFEYATRYCGEKPAPASFRSFKLSDAEYADFMSWIKNQPFTYTSEIEKQTEKLIATAQKDQIYSELKESLQQLQAKVQANRRDDLLRFRSEIVDQLEREIAFHYQLQAGQTEVAIAHDPEIIAARDVLRLPGAYQKLLAPR
jgi:carboxyl-terminal processing protease